MKLFTLLLICLSCTLSFSSCKDDNDPELEPEPIVMPEDPIIATIVVEDAGTLSTLIRAERKHLIGKLTISGPINGTDIRYIREMNGLNILDMKDARIIKGGDFYYYVNAKEYTTSDNVVGEQMFNGLKVMSINLPDNIVAIDDYAFYGCNQLDSIEIPNTVARIGDQAFGFCSSLVDIDIPAKLEYMGDGAFQSCKSLKSLFIPNAITSISKNLFSDCTSLTKFETDNNPKYKAVDGTLYDMEANVLFSHPMMHPGETINIPNNITKIGHQAFGGCKLLKEVQLLDHITDVESEAFQDCVGLESIVFSKNINVLNNSILRGCTVLKSAILPDNITIIYAYAFALCTNLTSITIPNKVQTIQAQTFLGCLNLAEIHVSWTKPNSQTYYLGDVYKRATLYIPKGTLNAYRNTYGWQDFSKIVEE